MVQGFDEVRRSNRMIRLFCTTDDISAHVILQRSDQRALHHFSAMVRNHVNRLPGTSGPAGGSSAGKNNRLISADKAKPRGGRNHVSHRECRTLRVARRACPRPRPAS